MTLPLYPFHGKSIVKNKTIIGLKFVLNIKASAGEELKIRL